MKKIILTFLSAALVVGLAFGQTYKGEISASKSPALNFHYQPEHTLDVPMNPGAWNTGHKGLNVAFGSTESLYFRTEVPEVKKENQTWSATGWKGERLNSQILVWSADTLQQVRFKVSDLVNAKGDVIGKDKVSLNMVRYVISNYPYGAADVDCGPSPYKDFYLMPDRFEKFDRFDVPGRTARPVWLSLDIAQNTATGLYKGTIEVRSKGQVQTLTVNINVQNQVLPKPYDWKYRLDLWQNPSVIAAQYNIEPWSEEYKVLLKKHLQLYADAGGKYITTYAVHSPWADASYTIEDGMIDWVKTSNGSWKFDYKIFDAYVELAMSVGIDKAITIYTPVPWANRFRYKDEQTGEYITEQWEPGSAQFKSFWDLFLTDLRSHLEKKGWFDITYIGINENPLEQTLTAIKVIKENSSKWRITYAGDWHPQLDMLLDDYSFLHGKESDMDKVKARKARGASTTYYVCCNPPKPNNFVFSPPVEGRWVSWYAAAYGYDGFLRWAYDAWTGDVLRDARHNSWAAGDCYLIYPGANSSIRFEKMREGIVDFEKMNILREQLSKSNDKKSKKLMNELDGLLKNISTQKDFSEALLKNQIATGQKLIEEISNLLAAKS